MICDFENPRALSTIVDKRWILFNLFIVSSNLTGHWGVDISSDLHALNYSSAVLLLHGLAGGGELNMDDFSKLLLGIVRYANLSYLLLRVVLNPLMAFSVSPCWVREELLAKKCLKAKTDLMIMLRNNFIEIHTTISSSQISLYPV